MEVSDHLRHPSLKEGPSVFVGQKLEGMHGWSDSCGDDNSPCLQG